MLVGSSSGGYVAQQVALDSPAHAGGAAPQVVDRLDQHGQRRLGFDSSTRLGASPDVVPWDRALLNVVKGSVVRTKSRAAPNTPLRGSYEEARLCIVAGQRRRRHGLTLALRIRRLGVRIPSGAHITTGQDHFLGAKPLACSDQTISHSG